MSPALGEVCTFGDFECSQGAKCLPPIKGGMHGICQCKKLIGLSGPRCDEVTGAGWMFLTGCAISLLFTCYVIGANVDVGREMKARGKLKLDDMGRTLIYNFMLAVTIACFDIGTIISVRPSDRKDVNL